MDESEILFQETFAQVPPFVVPPKTKYVKKWKRVENNRSNKLFLTVVENPSLRLVKIEKAVKRYCKTKLINSENCVPQNAVKVTRNRKLSFDYFRSEPFTPFIPDLLLYGVNKIETECHELHDWGVYYNCDTKAEKDVCDKILEFNCLNPTATEQLKELLNVCSMENLALCVLRFFTIFHKKILHFDTKNLKQILNYPLYDKFLRPNENIKNIVKESVLKSSRTRVDTLCFMMIHILHIWEYSNMPVKSKIEISQLFGPRLISFEDPIYLYNIEDASSPQSAMLEAILEICDFDFWVTMNFNHHKEVFVKETHMEIQRSKRTIPRRTRPLEFAYMCNPYSLFPNISETWTKYEDEDYKNTNFYKKLIAVLQVNN